MSTMSESARAAAKSKVERLVRADPNERVDASGYRPDGAMDADVSTAMRPVSRRAFRRGGKVAGESAPTRADRKPRASGGATAYMNRDMKEANKDRGGLTHIGGMKAGGKVHGKGCDCARCSGGRVGHARGGPAINDGTRPTAGRMARKGGGRTKGKTNINIIIAPQGGSKPPMMPMGGAPPPGGPVGLHQGAPPPAPMGPPAGAPPPMMARKSGGRTGHGEGFGAKLIKPGAYPIESGAGGGLGRLEKAKAARP